ncbi:hypothetical protein T484DRAFT_3116310 [Baffinella frigidus]|nr:hypothetical protein T484DRAFT_3116310 [Cryptophyta sp. CCMP2293]
MHPSHTPYTLLIHPCSYTLHTPFIHPSHTPYTLLIHPCSYTLHTNPSYEVRGRLSRTFACCTAESCHKLTPADPLAYGRNPPSYDV